MPLRESEFSRIDKLFANRLRPSNRAYIDERNLQIHFKEVAEQSPAQSFSKIVNDIRNTQVAQAQAGANQAHESERLNFAMKEAKESFEAMMEFHNKIKEAYQNIVEMQ